MMLNDASTALSLLSTRRSGKPRELVAPGPDGAQLDTILTIAARTPDHGKLAPWRFVVMRDRDAFATMLQDAAAGEAASGEKGAPGDKGLEQFAHCAPVLVAVLSCPQGDKIPRFDQRLSAGAACQNLLLAAHALGFAGGWLTGWAAGSRTVVKALGGGKHDRIAGFMFLGTLPDAPSERPRPDRTDIVRSWP